MIESQHGTSPDQWLVTRIEKSDGDYFQPVGFERLNAVLARGLRLPAKPEHHGDVRAVHISIEQAHFVALASQATVQDLLPTWSSLLRPFPNPLQ